MLAMSAPSYRSPDANRAGRRTVGEVICLAALTTLLRVILLPPLWLRWLVAGSSLEVWRRQRTVALMNALFMFRLAAAFDVHNICACLTLGAWRADAQGLILSFAASRHRARRDAARAKLIEQPQTPEDALQLSASLLQRIGGTIKQRQHPGAVRRALCTRFRCCEGDEARRQARLRGAHALQAELLEAGRRMSLLAETGLSFVQRSRRSRQLSALDVDVMFRMALFTAPRSAGCHLDAFAERPDSTWWGRSVEEAARVSGLPAPRVTAERTACRIGVCSAVCSLAVALVIFIAVSVGTSLAGAAEYRSQVAVLGHFGSKAHRRSMAAAPLMFPETFQMAHSIPLRGNLAALWLLASTDSNEPSRCSRFEQLVFESDARRDSLRWQWQALLPLGLSHSDLPLYGYSYPASIIQTAALGLLRIPLSPIRLVLNAALHAADTTLGLLPYIANVPSLPVLLNCHDEGRPSALRAVSRASLKDLWKFLPLYDVGEWFGSASSGTGAPGMRLMQASASDRFEVQRQDADQLQHMAGR